MTIRFKPFAAIAAALLLLPMAGFSKSKARLYNLATGEVLEAGFSQGLFHTGHGKIWVTLPSGAKLTGEYTTVPDGAAAWGSIYTSVVSANGVASGSGSVSSSAISMLQRGSAIASGQGEVFECEYMVSAFSGHGSGGCHDRGGNLYRLMF